MPIWVEYILAFLLVAGGAFALIGSYGLAKLNDFYMRLHGPTKATTLGLGCILTVSAVYFTMTADVVSLNEYLIVVFLFITAPVSAHLLSKTALAEGFHYTSDQANPLDHPLNVGTTQTHDATGVDDLSDADEAYLREMRAEEAAMMEQAHAEDDAYDEEVEAVLPMEDEDEDIEEDLEETSDAGSEAEVAPDADDAPAAEEPSEVEEDDESPDDEVAEAPEEADEEKS